ncbi:MAG: hypothetical protein V4692_07955 [Bdellovibrionota bacterium]
MDQLYSIFEQHLFHALVEDEGSDVFIDRVVADYVDLLQSKGTVIPREYMASIEEDLKEEVLEMLRKKTYGHYDLNSFRKAHAATPGANEKTRRLGRAS